MMATSHGLWGMALAIPVAALAPEFTPIALIAGFLGGIAPDADLYVGHRKTLHFPFLGTVVAVVTIGLALAIPSALTVAIAVGVTAAAMHAVADGFGGGLELRPWEASSERAVYSHMHGRWITPRRLIRYDGAPEDLVVAGLVAFPILAIGPGWIGWLVGAMLVLSTAYVILRRRLADLAVTLVSYVPEPFHRLLPRRYLGA